MKSLHAFVLISAFALGACRGGGNTASEEGIIASIENISPKLQQKEDLRYTLLCAKTRQAALTEIDAVDIKKGAVGETVKLQFSPKKPVQSGDFCRVEVRGAKDAVYASDYEFQVDKDLFYSSTKGEVIKGSGAKYSLQIKIYKVFLDLKEESRALNAEITFPADALGKFALELTCGKKKYPASFTITRDSGVVFKGAFTIPYTDYADAATISCSDVSAIHDNNELHLAAKIEPELKVEKVDKSIAKATLVAVVVPGTSVETSVEKAECGEGEVFDPVTEKCVPK